MMTSQQIRQQFLDFFQKRGHTLMPPSSLVPEGDASVLFTTAGMQQFKPYYTEPHLAPSARLCSIQPSFRTSDIEEVGDNRHLTMFEMQGNFSFGYQMGQDPAQTAVAAYFKETAIELAYEYLFEVLAIDKARAYVTVYQGSPEKNIPRDEQSAAIWQRLGITDIRYEGDDNFWGPTGSEGPCGPTSEIYIDDIEVWNLVFNQYYADSQGRLTPLKHQGVDTGSGLERMAIVLQGKKEVFETDLFAPILAQLKTMTDQSYQEKPARIIADHLKAAMFLIADGIRPSNKAQGYVLRRLIRRAVINAQAISLPDQNIPSLIKLIVDHYQDPYQQLATHHATIVAVISEEIIKFNRTLQIGLKEYEKTKQANQQQKQFPADQAFKLFDTFGFPLELTIEMAERDGFNIDKAAIDERFKSHQQVSRAGQDQVFKGGLADHEPQTIKHHTAHHLLLAALRQVLGDHVHQRGSNVTAERLRIDFSHPEKMTPEQLEQVEAIVNQKVSQDLEVQHQEMPKAEAEQLGAQAEFGAKYGETVSVYTILNQDGSVFSREFCGGPHVNRTSELGSFKILKEEASSAGIRRIKARVN